VTRILAAHLAAVAPVTVPVMRLVHAAVSWPAETAHLAEVFLGGLMHRTDAVAEDMLPQHLGFDFTPEARRILLDTVPASELARTVHAVATHIRQLAGRSGDFPAWLAQPRDSSRSRAADGSSRVARPDRCPP
jgi:hypothetical protein